MGWRSVKDYFNIEYIVHINKAGNLCVGTLSRTELITVSPSGKLLKRYEGNQSPLIQIQENFECQKLKLSSLFNKEDKTDCDAQVFYFDEDGLHEDTYIFGAAPIVTTSGRLLTENFYLNISDALREAIKSTKRRNELLKQKLSNTKVELEANKNLLDKLVAIHQSRPRTEGRLRE